MASKKTDAARLSEIRDQIAALADEVTELEHRPVSRDEAIAAADRWIKSRAAELKGDIQVGNLLRGEAYTRLSVIRASGTELEPTLCALVPQAVRDFLVEQIDDQLAATEPISDEDRKQRRQEIDGERLALEREEEAIVQRLQAAGQQVDRRGGADPRAILGLDTAPKRPAPPAEAEERASVAHGPSKTPQGDKI